MSWLLILQISHIIFSILLIVLVLLQAPEKGLSGLFGGGGEIFHTKRGAEKLFFILTIVITTLFGITSILNFFLT
ncbi:preprotein translocase subunit SecG [Patescibacteria group bacterium]|nr:preprotein translocase subunit SecG [Patescibacteria group bacterium]MBU1867920.1 preprotein translocase subunit SecG [Patescibacteria group bacterium]